MSDSELRLKISGYDARLAETARLLVEKTIAGITELDNVGDGQMTVSPSGLFSDDLREDLEAVGELLDKTLSGYWIYARYEIIRQPDLDTP